MDLALAIARTPAGSREIRERCHPLNTKQRALLILIDGSRDAAFHKEQALRLGLPSDTLDELLRLDLVAEVAANSPQATSADATDPHDAVWRFMAARRLMNDAVVDALGLRAFFFTLKIERTGSLDDLRRLIPDYSRQLRRVHATAVADELVGRAEQLLVA